VADAAANWLTGQGDLIYAGMGRPVPVTVQLGVLAHADLDRLKDLGRLSRRGSVRRAWGTEMAQLAGDVARRAATPERLRRLQAKVLVPLELDVLAGRTQLSSRDHAIEIIKSLLPVEQAYTSH
jgi:hypothetical protein